MKITDLSGWYLLDIYVESEGQNALAVTAKDGAWGATKSFVFECDGDCCSETWIADVFGVPQKRGARILSVGEMDVQWVDDGRSRQEEDKFYGYLLRTDLGCISVIFRNSSNGYHGGELREAQPWAYIREWEKIGPGNWSAPGSGG